MRPKNVHFEQVPRQHYLPPSLGTALENLGGEVTAVVTGKAVLGTSSHQCQILGCKQSPSHKYLMAPHLNPVRQVLLLPHYTDDKLRPREIK